MTATLEKRVNKKNEHFKLERFLLKQACKCPQKLEDFYRSVICYNFEGQNVQLAEEKYNLLADNEAVGFFFNIVEKLNLDCAEEKNNFIDCVQNNFFHSSDLEIIEIINGIFSDNDIVGWFYSVWSFVEKLCPIAFHLPFDEKEKEVIKFLLYKGDMEAATDVCEIPKINNSNVFISNFLLKTGSSYVNEGLFKVYCAHCTQSENLATLEKLMEFNCALAYREIDFDRINDGEKEYLKNIIEGVIRYDYDKQQTAEAKAEYLKSTKRYLDDSDKSFVDDLTAQKHFQTRKE